MMKSLKDSVIFNAVNTLSSKNLIETITKLNIADSQVTLDKFSNALDEFKRKYKYPLSAKILRDITELNILPVYSENTEYRSIPSFLPCWLNKSTSGKITSIVNLSIYPDIKFFKDGNFDRDTRVLFSLLQDGCVLKNIYERYDRISGNINVVKLSAQCYISLFMKVLDKLYSIKLNEMKEKQISLLIAKFFLINVMGRENNVNTTSLALNIISHKTNETYLTDIDNVSSSIADKYLNLDEFFKYLREAEPMLRNITVESFYYTWINLYGYQTLLGIDLYQYFLMMIFTAVVGTQLNKSYVISGAIKNKADLQLYIEIANMFN